MRCKFSRNKRYGFKESSKDSFSDKKIKENRDLKSVKKSRLDIFDFRKEKGFLIFGRKLLFVKLDLVGLFRIDEVWLKVNIDSLKNF